MPIRSMFQVAFAVLCCAVAARAPAADEWQAYLPTAGSFDADYVVLEPDPAYDAFGQKLQGAMREHGEWMRDWMAKHPGQTPLPYHPNFGVPKDQYYKYQDPLNHYLEVARQRIHVTQQRAGSVIKLTLQGQGLMFDRLEIDTTTPAVKTAKDTLQFRERVEQAKATLKPGAVVGQSFESPAETARQRRFVERVLVGRLTEGTQGGIVRYSLSTPGKTVFSYVTFPRK